MTTLARVGDQLSCGDVIATGSGNVFINGLPAVRIGVDMTAGHCHSPTLIYKQSRPDNRVRINGIEAAVVGDFNWVGGSCNVGCNTPQNDHCATIIAGSPDVNAP